ncbi:MAG: ParB/RepB/Spo0J family partition protein [Alphaproteobacteria bacterium]|nr:ParB/RepB/Spo0J family partition protein [Alphaproteobacteria bacterium]MBQ3162934.1 ParB/RepB/Spo0J family partition protein [Lachnospiraceae bacterium]
MRKRNNKEIQLTSYDDLLGINSEESEDTEKIIIAPLTELYTFKDHPFRVVDDEKMEETTESIRQYGVLMPGIARPRAEGGYELIAGHRRKRGSELAGRSEMPIIVRNYTDDEATIIMVDSNIQREDILPSEKAKAYKMKFEAMKHQGSKAEKNTYDEVGEAAGDNGKMVQRYIRLAELIPELLNMVDEKKLGFISGVDISYLSVEEQTLLYKKIMELNVVPNGTQAATLKKYSLSGELNAGVIDLLLSEEKPKAKKVTLKADRIKEYFTAEYSNDEIEEVIYELLEKWKQEGGRR